MNWESCASMTSHTKQTHHQTQCHHNRNHMNKLLNQNKPTKIMPGVNYPDYPTQEPLKTKSRHPRKSNINNSYFQYISSPIAPIVFSIIYIQAPIFKWSEGFKILVLTLAPETVWTLRLEAFWIWLNAKRLGSACMQHITSAIVNV